MVLIKKRLTLYAGGLFIPPIKKRQSRINHSTRYSKKCRSSSFVPCFLERKKTKKCQYTVSTRYGNKLKYSSESVPFLRTFLPLRPSLLLVPFFLRTKQDSFSGRCYSRSCAVLSSFIGNTSEVVLILESLYRQRQQCLFAFFALPQLVTRLSSGFGGDLADGR